MMPTMLWSMAWWEDMCVYSAADLLLVVGSDMAWMDPFEDVDESREMFCMTHLVPIDGMCSCVDDADLVDVLHPEENSWICRSRVPGAMRHKSVPYGAS